MDRTLITCCLATVVAVSVPAASLDERLERLSVSHRAWLEEEIVHIITDPEKEVFLSLESIEERDRFIEAFWRKRDPNRTTPLNEFREEHYRRVDYANRFLGRETYRDGWQTDRGRYYILLGKPISVQRYEGYNELVSVELWFYQGDVQSALPAYFYLLFFRRSDIGEYQLYHPVGDGPTAAFSTRNADVHGSGHGVAHAHRAGARNGVFVVRPQRSTRPRHRPRLARHRSHAGPNRRVAEQSGAHRLHRCLAEISKRGVLRLLLQLWFPLEASSRSWPGPSRHLSSISASSLLLRISPSRPTRLKRSSTRPST